MALPVPEERFKTRLIEFIEFTKSVIVDANNAGIHTPVAPLILDLGKIFIEKEDAGKIVQTFTIRSIKNWDRIKSRDIQFIRGEGMSFFNGVPESNLKAFSDLYNVLRPDGTKLFNESVTDIVFDYFDSLVRLSVCYAHTQRCPDPVTKKYTKNFFPDMKIKSEVERWGITKLE
jgi:hypothetical protein